MRNPLLPALAGLAFMTLPALSEPVLAPQFQLIIRQAGDVTTGLNAAIGQGENVQFFSNLGALDVDWQQQGDGVQIGTLTDGAPRHILLGVCAGGRCNLGEGLSFTSSIAPPP